MTEEPLPMSAEPGDAERLIVALDVDTFDEADLVGAWVSRCPSTR